MSSIRILYVIGQLSVGGTEIQLLELTKNLDREKYKITIACLSQSDTLAQSFREIDCDVIVLGREQRGRISVLYDLYRIQKRFQPDVIHSFAYASRAAIPISKLFFSNRNILSIRNQPDRYITRVDMLINSFADYTLANSQKAASDMRFGFKKRVPVQVIYNGLNISEFDVNSEADFPFDFDSSEKIICATGNLYPVKGLDVLLDSFAIVLKKFPAVQLWLAGKGPEEDNLRRQSIRLGIETKVKFLGYQKNIPAVLKQVHVGVLASRSEGLPNAIIEYMASGLPVVATDVGGIGEVVEQNKTGKLVPFGDPQKMAEELCFFLQNPEFRRLYGRAGRKRVEKYFSIERLISEMEEIYEKILK